jgi:hypothetical protein
MSPSPMPHSQDFKSDDADRAFGVIDELAQRWGDRLCVGNLRLSERYFKAELEFGFVLKAAGQQFVAIASQLALYNF